MASHLGVEASGTVNEEPKTGGPVATLGRVLVGETPPETRIKYALIPQSNTVRTALRDFSSLRWNTFKSAKHILELNKISVHFKDSIPTDKFVEVRFLEDRTLRETSNKNYTYQLSEDQFEGLKEGDFLLADVRGGEAIIVKAVKLHDSPKRIPLINRKCKQIFGLLR